MTSSASVVNVQSGFTLIELLLSVAIIMILGAVSVPVYQSFQVRNDLDIATVTIAQGIRRAEALAQAVDGDATWGISIQSGSFSVFKGSSYAGRDATVDEVFTMSTSITPSGVSEIVFTRLTGLPQTTGTIVLTSSANEIRTITLNAKGMVDY